MAIYFTFVRHGQTVFNRIDRMQGRCDSPLTEAGIRQAENTASALRNEHFDHIFCSSSERAWDTAKIIAAFHEEEPLPMKELKEFDFGDFDGVLKEDFREIIEAHRTADEWTDVHGENVELFGKRAEKTFEKILSMCSDGDHVLLVSHGSFLSHMLKTLIDYDFDDYLNRMNRIGRVLVPNCSISEFVYEDGKYTLTREPATADEYRASLKKELCVVLAETGETIFEKAGRKEGWSDSSLTEEGIRKTYETAEEMKDIPFDCALVSTAERARDTADILLEGRNTPVLYEKELRERYFGLLEGDEKINMADIEDESRYEMESMKELKERAARMMRMIYDISFDQDSILVVTHKYFCGELREKFLEAGALIEEYDGWYTVSGVNSEMFTQF